MVFNLGDPAIVQVWVWGLRQRNIRAVAERPKIQQEGVEGLSFSVLLPALSKSPSPSQARRKGLFLMRIRKDALRSQPSRIRFPVPH